MRYNVNIVIIICITLFLSCNRTEKTIETDILVIGGTTGEIFINNKKKQKLAVIDDSFLTPFEIKPIGFDGNYN